MFSAKNGVNGANNLESSSSTKRSVATAYALSAAREERRSLSKVASHARRSLSPERLFNLALAFAPPADFRTDGSANAENTME